MKGKDIYEVKGVVRRDKESIEKNYRISS